LKGAPVALAVISDAKQGFRGDRTLVRNDCRNRLGKLISSYAVAMLLQCPRDEEMQADESH